MTVYLPSDLVIHSMGTAWSNSLSYPWEHGYYVGGIETVKVNIMLRIYSNKWHVYAGLAILNPAARTLIDQYARSATEIFKFMLNADESHLRDRIYAARENVFGAGYGEGSNSLHHPILLSEHILDQFSLSKSTPDPAKVKAKANSHLSLLAMVDCWSHLHIRPFHHLSLAATPIFRLWIGVAEYLFRSRARLDAALDAALYDVSHRSDDLEFVLAARGWSQCVHFGSFELYQRRFEETASFFESRFEEANRVGDAMISAIMQSSQESDSGLA
jgi:prephenate dehydrogenase (NADP+)